MAARSDEGRTPTRRIVALGAIGGLLAGMTMAVVEMVYGWVDDAHHVWDAPMAIWAWVFGLEHFGEPANHVWPILLGTGAHMMNSIVIGVVFALIAFAARPGGLVGSLMVGLAYGLALWVLMRYALLPLNDPESALFTTDLVSPQWVWWLAHAALGLTAGAFYYGVAARARPASARRRRVDLGKAG